MKRIGGPGEFEPVGRDEALDDIADTYIDVTIEEGTEGAVSAMRNSNERAHLTLEAARASGLALDQITQAITAINERNLVIASAAEEQAQVAREVDRNLVNINDLSVQSATGAHQTSAASAELSRLAVGLNGLVARFSV